MQTKRNRISKGFRKRKYHCIEGEKGIQTHKEVPKKIVLGKELALEK